MEKEKNFRNFIEYPINMSKPKNMKNRNCCGFAATGDDAGTATPEAATPDNTVKATVRNITIWNYAKTGLAILGAYVAIKFIWGKIPK
jgi:hypothetical protein